jgi:SlyX protein
MAERLARAEAAVAHVERQYDELNAVVVEQGRVIERLRRQVERLTETLQHQELDRIRSTSSKPPHYQP